MEQTKSKEMQIAESLILKTFSFLENDYLYVPKVAIEESKVCIESLEIEYLHKIKRRNVTISYTKGKVYDDIKYSFHLTIGRIPHSGWEDMISMYVFLSSKNKDFSASMINEFKEDDAEQILQRLSQELRTELSDVIDGSVWHENYYPRKD